MPKAAQATRQSVKGQSIIEEMSNIALQITLPAPGLLPDRKCRPLSIFPGDDVDRNIPGDVKHTGIRLLVSRLKPGSGKIDYLILMPRKKNAVLQVQLQASHDSKGVRERVDSALRAAGYPPKSSI